MLYDSNAQSLIYRVLTEDKFPVNLLLSVHREFFIAPSYEEFREKTVWSLENAFTSAFKQLRAVRQYELTARLGKFLAAYTQAFKEQPLAA